MEMSGMPFVSIIQKIRPAPLQVVLLSLFGFNKRKIMQLGAYKFYADPTSNFGMSIVKGEYESELVGLLRKYLTPGCAFLDLGANEGYFAVIASKLVGPAGRVVAVEPQSRLGPVILKNLTLNECTNCTIVQAATSDHNGEITIHLAPTTNTGSTSVFHSANYKVEKEIVRSYRLGDLLNELGIAKFDLVKVDIEGAEYGVFMAAKDVLLSGRLARIELEFHSDILRRQGYVEEYLHTHMLKCGYVLESESPRIYAFQHGPVG
jgi:FkbM family methyltransferase